MFDNAFEVVVLALILLLIYLVINWLYRSIKIDKKAGDLYVLVTGCDTGFGNRCARKLDLQGFHIFAACLTEDKVKDLSSSCSERLVSFQMDVTDEATIERAFEIVRKHLPSDTGLWAIINNAGIMGPIGVCEWLKKSDFEATVGVNVLGMISVTRIFLPLVRKAKGRIVNTASVLGRFASTPAPYAVSKYCVRGYSDALRREMVQMGISVHTIEPGGYNTNITNADLHCSSMDKVYSRLDEEVKEFYGEDFKKRKYFKAEGATENHTKAESGSKGLLFGLGTNNQAVIPLSRSNVIVYMYYYARLLSLTTHRPKYRQELNPVANGNQCLKINILYKYFLLEK